LGHRMMRRGVLEFISYPDLIQLLLWGSFQLDLPAVDTLPMSNNRVEVSPSGCCIVVCFGNRAVRKWLISDSSHGRINKT
jgi:hypothetical protein